MIPYPHATADHQRANAEALQRIGAARILDDGGLDARALRAELESALEPQTLEALSAAAKNAARRDPRAAIVDRVKALGFPKNGRP